MLFTFERGSERGLCFHVHGVCCFVISCIVWISAGFQKTNVLKCMFVSKAGDTLKKEL